MIAGESAGSARLVTPPFIGLAAAVFVYFVAAGMFIPATPRLAAGPLGGDALAVGLVIGSFSLTSVVLRPLAGRWTDRRGRRLMLVAGSLIQVAAAAGHLAADSLALLVIARLALGAAEAVFFVGGLAAATDLAPEARRGEAVSLISTALYLGVAVGPVFAEALFGLGGYAWVWVAAALISVLAVGLSCLAPETLPPTARRASTSTAPLLHRRGLIPGLLVLSGAWGMGAYLAFLPLIGDQLGLDGVGGYLAVYALVVVSMRIVGARLPDRIGAVRLSGAALLLCAAGMGVVGIAPTEGGLWLATVIYAAGIAFTFPAIITLAVKGVPAAERGAVVGTTSLFLDVAFGLSPALLGLLATVVGYPPTFLVSAAVALVGAGYLAMRGGRLAPQALDA